MKKTFLAIFVLLVLTVGSYFLFNTNRPKTDIPVQTIDQNPPVATTTVYKNDLEGFSFSYPNEFSLADKETISEQQWEYSTTDPGTLISRVVIPRTIQPKTNFGAAAFNVGISDNERSVKDCLIAPVGESINVSTSTINGITYSVFHYTDVGAGNYYDVSSYHTIHKGKCVVLESMIHSSNIANYSPDQGISEFDKSSVNKILDGILDTFSFHN